MIIGKRGQGREITARELFALDREDVLALLEQRYRQAGQGYIEFVLSCYDLYHESRERLYVTSRPQ